MRTDQARQLAASDRAYLVAPAGHGKTYTIAEAVSLEKEGRQLILTHTHAGVHALKRKLKERHVSARSAHVDTIDGWALRYAKAYPTLSGLAQEIPDYHQIWAPESSQDWQAARGSATRLLQTRTIREVVGATYNGLYVDEYQDCTLAQHDLVITLADILRCRIVCDPLQSIFDFRGESPPDVDALMGLGFVEIPQLPLPWRWHEKNGGNPALGEWLGSSVRLSLERDGAVDLSGKLPDGVEFCELPAGDGKHQALYKKCNALAGVTGTTVVIRKRREECYALTRRLNGKYLSIEEIYSSDLLKWCNQFSDITGGARISALLEFARSCWTAKPADIDVVEMLAKGEKKSFVRRDEHAELIGALGDAGKTDDPSAVLRVLDLLTPLAKWHRWELWQDMRRSIRTFCSGGHASLSDAAWHVRHKTSQIGRWLPARVVSTPLLIKGLEFDHAIVIDPSSLDREELYVALTRGSRTLTILSAEPVISVGRSTTRSTSAQQTRKASQSVPAQGTLF